MWDTQFHPRLCCTRLKLWQFYEHIPCEIKTLKRSIWLEPPQLVLMDVHTGFYSKWFHVFTYCNWRNGPISSSFNLITSSPWIHGKAKKCIHVKSHYIYPNRLWWLGTFSVYTRQETSDTTCSVVNELKTPPYINSVARSSSAVLISQATRPLRVTTPSWLMNPSL